MTKNLRVGLSTGPEAYRAMVHSAVRQVIASLRKNSRLSRSGIPKEMILGLRAGLSRGAAAEDHVQNNPCPQPADASFSSNPPRLVWIGSNKEQVSRSSYREFLDAVVQKGLKLTPSEILLTSVDIIDSSEGGIPLNILEGAEAIVLSGSCSDKLVAKIGEVTRNKLLSVLALEDVTSNPHLKRQLWHELQPVLALLGTRP